MQRLKDNTDVYAQNNLKQQCLDDKSVVSVISIMLLSEEDVFVCFGLFVFCIGVVRI